MDQAESRNGQEQSAQDGRKRTAPLYPVIVGYDGSNSARNALAYAAGMARRQERSLLGVFVTSTCGPATAMGVPVARARHGRVDGEYEIFHARELGALQHVSHEPAIP